MTNEEFVLAIQKSEAPDEMLVALYDQNRSFMRKLCRKFSYDQEMEDLMQVAYIGMHAAVYRYKPEIGVKLLTYAYYIIRRELQRYVDESGHLIRVSVREQRLWYEYRRAEEYLSQRLLREPTVYELASVMEMPVRDVLKLRETFYKTDAASLDAPIDEGAEYALTDFVADAVNLEYEQIENDFSQHAASVMQTEIELLEEEQQRVIRLSMQGFTHDQIGASLACTREHVRSVEWKAMRRLGCRSQVKQLARDMGIVV